MTVVMIMTVTLAGCHSEPTNTQAAQYEIKLWTVAVAAFKADHPTIGYPPTLKQLLQKDEEGFGPYITNEERLTDPWNQEYQYEIGGKRNGGKQPDIFTVSPGGRIIG